MEVEAPSDGLLIKFMQDLFDSKISYIAKQSQMLFLLRSSESNSYGDHILKKKKIQ